MNIHFTKGFPFLGVTEELGLLSSDSDSTFIALPHYSNR